MNSRPTKILVIDNYDSFVFNLVQYLGQIGAECTVLRNDEVKPEDAKNYDGVLISPGPGTPEEAGVSIPMVKFCAENQIPLFGVCLGHQAIGEVFGATLQNLNTVYHGVANTITQTSDDSLFNNLPQQLQVGRYHSWVINKVDFPESLEITSLSENGDIMSIRHKLYNVKGIQFHPESILTPQGKTILSNWIIG